MKTQELLKFEKQRKYIQIKRNSLGQFEKIIGIGYFKDNLQIFNQLRKTRK